VVVDECHRAVGKSDIVVAIEKLRQERCKFRVLGLSATPGSRKDAVQVPTSHSGSFHLQ
jgi:Fanconi anemia group M protein